MRQCILRDGGSTREESGFHRLDRTEHWGRLPGSEWIALVRRRLPLWMGTPPQEGLPRGGLGMKWVPSTCVCSQLATYSGMPPVRLRCRRQRTMSFIMSCSFGRRSDESEGRRLQQVLVRWDGICHVTAARKFRTYRLKKEVYYNQFSTKEIYDRSWGLSQVRII